ncbi:beta-lactamase/transpeptidase-like protein [Rhizoclosmatium globosum]|uniref:Beta-lactamase/transpeptidase-like protein n=1 Tax=Rhizoclosmatium globosum TaxID=329046 RepID=A0A1Y2AYC2_9FUNG|nr:beta-lactamase/transpeptidase-like protein [Rhizoclosmatium globosum]|eukprot:ORY27593.1 beta-lactamase/transpeptidase-like protein [Rhizoclosmatium globosum]
MTNGDGFGWMRIVVVLGLLNCFYSYFLRYGPVFHWQHKMFGLYAQPLVGVYGTTEPGYENLKTIMHKGLKNGEDLGSQFTAYVDGNLVADIAGGFTTTHYKTRYRPYHLQQVFSCSKFVTSTVFLHLANTNRINLSDPISKHWPEFSHGNKSHVTIQHLLQHRSGVAFLDKERIPTPEDLLNLDLLASKIAGQPHNFNGTQVSAYHAVTRGWYLNEIARRVTGLTVREIMYTEIMPLLNKNHPDSPFEFHYGIPDGPADLVESLGVRVAPLDSASYIYKIFHAIAPNSFLSLFGHLKVDPALINAYFFKDTESSKSLIGSGPDFKGREAEFPWSYNDAVLRRSQSPSFNVLTNSRSLAWLAEVVRRSAEGGEAAMLAKEVYGFGYKENRVTEVDRVLLGNITFTQCGMGVFRDGFGPSKAGAGVEFVGWTGAGGSVVFFSEEFGISLSFTPNFMEFQAVGDQRSWRLIEELVRVVKEKRSKKSIETGEKHKDEDSGRDEL